MKTKNLRHLNRPVYDSVRNGTSVWREQNKKDYIPGANPREDDINLEKYLRQMMHGDPSDRGNPLILLEEHWSTEPDFINVENGKQGDYKHLYNGNVNPGDAIRNNLSVENLQNIYNRWNDQRVNSSNQNQKSTFGSWLREIYKFINADSERLGKFGLAQYKEKLPAMSILTQRAEELKKLRREKTNAPYSKAINNLLDRPSDHSQFSSEQINSMLDSLRSKDSIAKKFLENEFQDRYIGKDKNRLGILNQLSSEALESGEKETASHISRLNRKLKGAQTAEDLKLREVYLPLRENKAQLEDALINELGKYGRQEHLYGSEAEKRKKQVFDMEAILPHVKLENLNKVYSNINLEAGNPNSEPKAIEAMSKALLDYGIASGRGIENNFRNLNEDRLPSLPVFGGGDLTEFLPAEILESQYTLNRMDPKFKGEQYKKKKELQRDLYGSSKDFKENSKSKTLSNAVFKNVMSSLPQEMTRFDSAYERAIEEGMNQIAHKYMRLGQPGSFQQIRASENMIKRLTTDFDAKRRHLFAERLQEEEGFELTRLANQRAKLAAVGQEENTDANRILNATREINNRGVQKFNNLQAAKDLKSNKELERFRFDNSLPYLSLPALTAKVMNPNPEENAEARRYLDFYGYGRKNPFTPLEPFPSLKIDNINSGINFDENNLAKPDAHAARTRGSLKTQADYNPMRQEDARIAYSNNTKLQQEEKYRKTKIAEENKATRAAIVGRASPLDSEISDNDLKLIEYYLSRNDFDDAADLLESKTKKRFPLFPKSFANPGGFYWGTSRYAPQARTQLQQYLSDIKNKKKINAQTAN